MLLRSITLKSLLSFKETQLALRPLNVIIGPNAAGKSNLIDAIGLLKATPHDLGAEIRKGGAFSDWIWNGESPGDPSISCRLDGGLIYRLELGRAGEGFQIVDESLSPEHPGPGDPPTYFSRSSDQLKVMAPVPGGAGRTAQTEPISSFTNSALSSLRSTFVSPETAALGVKLSAIRIHRNWRTDAESSIRRGVAASASSDELADDGSNLALVLNEMQESAALGRVENYLERLLPNYGRLITKVKEGAVVVRIREGGILTPASRLSDGTLRFLCLLTALFHPKPPPLICIEEPESGLHPDALQLVAETLAEASERTQLIVTTHSESLVNALSGTPESVVICERDFDNSTQFERLEAARLQSWLADYSLGEVWRKGAIGGNRW